MAEAEVVKKENTKNKIKEPKKYRVIALMTTLRLWIL